MSYGQTYIFLLLIVLNRCICIIFRYILSREVCCCNMTFQCHRRPHGAIGDFRQTRFGPGSGNWGSLSHSQTPSRLGRGSTTLHSHFLDTFCLACCRCLRGVQKILKLYCSIRLLLGLMEMSIHKVQYCIGMDFHCKNGILLALHVPLYNLAV